MRLEGLGRLVRDHLSSAYLAFVAIFIAHASYVALRDHFTVPVQDDWRILDDFYSTPLVEWLLGHQNGHRVPVTLFLFFLDYEFLLGKTHLLILASLTSAFVAILALYIGFRAHDGLTSPLSKVVFGFTCFSLFWAGSCYDFLVGVLQASPLATMWFLLSVMWLALHCSGHLQGTPQSYRSLRLAGLAAVAATFSYGWGFASWASLIFLSIVARLPKRVVALLAVGAVTSLGAYSMGLEGASLERYAGLVRDRPGTVFEFTATLLGSPVGHVAHGFGYLETPEQQRGVSFAGGVIGLVALAAYASRLSVRPSRVHPQDLLALGLMTFPVTAALMVALNRWMFPPSSTAARFLLLATLFWMGAICAISSLVSRRDLTANGRVFGVGLIWLMTLCMIPALHEARAQHGARQQRVLKLTVMHLVGVQWDRLAGGTWRPSPERTYRVAARLREDRRSLFSDRRGDLVGSELQQHFLAAPPTRCDGSIGDLRPIPARAPAAQVFGRGWDVSEDDAPPFVVIADPDGVIRGLADFVQNEDERRLPKCTNEERCKDDAWFGFITEFDRSTEYAAYAVLTGGLSVCRLAAFSHSTS